MATKPEHMLIGRYVTADGAAVGRCSCGQWRRRVVAHGNTNRWYCERRIRDLFQEHLAADTTYPDET